MTNRTTRTLPRHYVAASLLVAAGIFGAAGAIIDRASRGTIEYAPPNDVPRLMADTFRLPPTASVVDFAGDTADLYFLDGIARTIVHVRRDSSAWTLHGVHARRGEGPGEFRAPFSLVILSDTMLAVSDLDELEFFDRDGVYLRTTRPKLPCPAGRVNLSSANGILFGSANCVRGDTMAATLFRYDDRRPATRILDEPRNSVSGSWGSIIAALRSIGDDAGGVTFGTGRTPCVVRQPAAPSDARRHCWPLQPYRTDAPPGFTKAQGPNAWPDTLPYYIDRTGSPSGRVFLLRPFSADSGVIVAADDRGGQPLMVVSLSAMIGCRAPGCAWTAELPNQTLILLVPLARLDSLAATRTP